MALINEKDKAIYLLNPRTASRATRLAMLESGWTELAGGYHADLSEIQWPRGTLCMVGRAPEGWTVYQTVRHPCSVMSTEYHTHEKLKSQRFPTLRSWLESYKPGEPMVGVHARKGKRTPASLFFEGAVHLRYENLDSELKRRWNLDLDRDPDHATKGKPKDWNKEWGEWERNWAREHLQDLDRYGYSV
jgi:hypothetical protein